MIGSCVVVEARIIYIYHTLSAFTFKSIVYVNEAHVTRQFMEYINILHMKLYFILHKIIYRVVPTQFVRKRKSSDSI